MGRTRIDAAVERMKQVREMLKGFLADLQPDEWFWQPHEGVTHIGWQVGHIAVAQYGLCLVRVRGEQVTDQLLISEAIRSRYGRGSTPDPDPAANASPAELLRVVDAVSEHAYSELALMSDSFLDVELEKPLPRFSTQLGAVEFCPSHELMHIGQIVLLRRLMGRPPGR